MREKLTVFTQETATPEIPVLPSGSLIPAIQFQRMDVDAFPDKCGLSRQERRNHCWGST
jgi:hypothetical protein